jgi:hypothetical protein
VASFVASGQAVLLVLGFMCIEVIVLILVRKKLPNPLTTLDLIVGVSAGAALLLALREALLQAPWQRVAVWLVVALGCHLWDLQRRTATRRT